MHLDAICTLQYVLLSGSGQPQAFLRSVASDSLLHDDELRQHEQPPALSAQAPVDGAFPPPRVFVPQFRPFARDVRLQAQLGVFAGRVSPILELLALVYATRTCALPPQHYVTMPTPQQ